MGGKLPNGHVSSTSGTIQSTKTGCNPGRTHGYKTSFGMTTPGPGTRCRPDRMNLRSTDTTTTHDRTATPGHAEPDATTVELGGHLDRTTVLLTLMGVALLVALFYLRS